LENTSIKKRRPLNKSKPRWKGNIKMGLRGNLYEGVREFLCEGNRIFI
jgi:hypothetical protein